MSSNQGRVELGVHGTSVLLEPMEVTDCLVVIAGVSVT